jgi:hypothetical protein
MTPSARDPLAAYLLVQAGLLRQRDLPPVMAAHAREHAQHLEGLAAFVRSLPESDERLLLLGTLAVRNSQLVPGGATQHALLTFVGTSPEDCDAFLTNLVHIARDDALARARAHGVLPQRRPS